MHFILSFLSSSIATVQNFMRWFLCNFYGSSWINDNNNWKILNVLLIIIIHHSIIIEWCCSEEKIVSVNCVNIILFSHLLHWLKFPQMVFSAIFITQNHLSISPAFSKSKFYYLLVVQLMQYN